MKRILDFFLLIAISFYSTHSSHTSKALSKFLIELPAMLVSSANNWGCSPTTFNIFPVKSFVKILNNRQEIPHPCPSPLPMCRFPNSDWMTRLLNISCTPRIVFSYIFSCLILANRRLWFTTSYAFAKSIKRIHTGSISWPSDCFFNCYTLRRSLYTFSSVPYPCMKPVCWWCSFH